MAEAEAVFDKIQSKILSRRHQFDSENSPRRAGANVSAASEQVPLGHGEGVQQQA